MIRLDIFDEGRHALLTLFSSSLAAAVVAVVPCYRLLSSLFGKSGPRLPRVKPRVEMSIEAINRRELLRALVTGVATSGEASVPCCFYWCSGRCWCAFRLSPWFLLFVGLCFDVVVIVVGRGTVAFL